VFDLQQVSQLPKSKVSEFFYKSLAGYLNLTFYDTGRHEGFCYCLNETTAKRGSNEVASCVVLYIDRTLAEHPLVKEPTSVQ